MFNKSLREAVEQHRKEDKEEVPSELQKKLLQEDKDNYEGWLNDPTTKKIVAYFEKEMVTNNIKLLNHCLGTGLERGVDDRRVLYCSLKNKLIRDMLRVLTKKN